MRNTGRFLRDVAVKKQTETDSLSSKSVPNTPPM